MYAHIQVRCINREIKESVTLVQPINMLMCPKYNMLYPDMMVKGER